MKLNQLFIFILILLFVQIAKAQKADTVSLFMTNQDRIVETKDSADYFLQIMMPPDISKGVRINDIKEYYINGNPKLIGSAVIYVDGKQLSFYFNGPKVDYFPNTHRKAVANYEVNTPVGDILQYYPNGKLYSVSKYHDGWYKLIECIDSTGNILAQNGKGKWMKFSDDFKHKTQEGSIKDSVEDGQWIKFENDSAKYTLTYKNGAVMVSTDPGQYSKHNTVFAAVEAEPQFKNGGAAGFNQFLARTVKFPAVDRINNTQGKVVVTFVVEKDGTLSDVKILRSPSLTMSYAAIEAVKQSPPWLPGMQNGKPVRVQYTIAFAFSLAGK